MIGCSLRQEDDKYRRLGKEAVIFDSTPKLLNGMITALVLTLSHAYGLTNLLKLRKFFLINLFGCFCTFAIEPILSSVELADKGFFVLSRANID